MGAPGTKSISEVFVAGFVLTLILILLIEMPTWIKRSNVMALYPFS